MNRKTQTPTVDLDATHTRLEGLGLNHAGEQPANTVSMCRLARSAAAKPG